MVRTHRFIRRALLLAAVLPALAAPSTGEVTWEKQTSQWFEAVPAGGNLRVVNAFGSVFARFGGYENRAEILATTQRIDRDLPALEVSRRVVKGGLVVTVAPVAGAPTGREAERRDRVDLVVYVPRGVPLDVRTESGGIEAKKLRSDLNATSVTGDIEIRSIQGRVRLETARGRIAATLETGVTEEPQRLTTVTGDIEVYLWEDADMDVDIATSGEISTDFSLEIEHLRSKEPGKHATATIGRGGPDLFLLSKRGRIRLLRLQKDFKPENDDGSGELP